MEGYGDHLVLKTIFVANFMDTVLYIRSDFGQNVAVRYSKIHQNGRKLGAINPNFGKMMKYQISHFPMNFASLISRKINFLIFSNFR